MDVYESIDISSGIINVNKISLNEKDIPCSSCSMDQPWQPSTPFGCVSASTIIESIERQWIHFHTLSEIRDMYSQTKSESESTSSRGPFSFKGDPRLTNTPVRLMVNPAFREKDESAIKIPIIVGATTVVTKSMLQILDFLGLGSRMIEVRIEAWDITASEPEIRDLMEEVSEVSSSMFDSEKHLQRYALCGRKTLGEPWGTWKRCPDPEYCAK